MKALSTKAITERDAAEGTCTFEGNTAGVPDGLCIITGARAGIDVPYRIESMTHAYSRGGGFVTSLNLKAALDKAMDNEWMTSLPGVVIFVIGIGGLAAAVLYIRQLYCEVVPDGDVQITRTSTPSSSNCMVFAPASACSKSKLPRSTSRWSRVCILDKPLG